MKIKTRKDGFLLPLALLALIVVAALTMNGFWFIKHHTTALEKKTTSEVLISRQKYFENLVFEADQVMPQNITSQSVSMSGLYNLSFMITRDVHDRPVEIEEQIAIVRRVLTFCTVAPSLADKIVGYLMTEHNVGKGFGLLDLLNEISVPMEVGLKLMTCVRVLPRSYKLNLTLASSATLGAYFDLNSSTANLLKGYLVDGTIPNHSSLNLFLQKRHKSKNFSRLLRNTTISALLDHKATVLEYDGETFAYLESVIDVVGNWTEQRNFFLWVPTN